MYRRHTIGGESWQVCQYYYTHNNGSSDDILLKQYRPLKIQKRRNSCPTQPGTSHLFLERNNTSLSRKKKRETLANILSNLSKKDDDALDKKWQSIDAQMSSLRTNTTLCVVNDTVIDIESLSSDESIESANAPLRRTPSPQRQDQQDEDKEDRLDMWLFLFGFLIFPFWWISAWHFFSKRKGKRNTKARIFQIINIWLSLASLILFGLVIGLTVSFAH